MRRRRRAVPEREVEFAAAERWTDEPRTASRTVRLRGTGSSRLDDFSAGEACVFRVGDRRGAPERMDPQGQADQLVVLRLQQPEAELLHHAPRGDVLLDRD